MNTAQLRSWLEKHIDDICSFMDYEPTLDSDEELRRTLGYWFDDQEVDLGGHRFVHLGIDGTGSQLAAWFRPGVDGPPPVVIFGSEGGTGVLVATPRDWAFALAHCPFFDTDEEPARLTVEDCEDEQALGRYQRAVERKLGDLPGMDELTEGLEDLNTEFAAWLEPRLPG